MKEISLGETPPCLSSQPWEWAPVGLCPNPGLSLPRAMRYSVLLHSECVKRAKGIWVREIIPRANLTLELFHQNGKLERGELVLCQSLHTVPTCLWLEDSANTDMGLTNQDGLDLQCTPLSWGEIKHCKSLMNGRGSTVLQNDKGWLCSSPQSKFPVGSLPSYEVRQREGTSVHIPRGESSGVSSQSLSSSRQESWVPSGGFHHSSCFLPLASEGLQQQQVYAVSWDEEGETTPISTAWPWWHWWLSFCNLCLDCLPVSIP